MKDILKLCDQLYEHWGDFDECLRQIYYYPESLDDETLQEIQKIYNSILNILMEIKSINDENAEKEQI